MNLKELKIDEKMIRKANDYQNFRNRIIKILTENNRYFDKFTITDRDTFDGYLAELSLFNYLATKTDSLSIWKKEIDIKLYKKIMNNDKLDVNDLNLLEDYFYDRYDIELCNTTRIDVKTAATHYNVNVSTWTYGIPVIQVDKYGKDVVVLIYVQYNKDPKFNKDAIPLKTILIGYLDVCDIRRLKKSTNNQNAGFDYQIENYESYLNNYKDIDDLIKKSCKKNQLK